MAQKFLTIYDKELEVLTDRLQQAKQRYDLFVAPLRKRRRILQVMKSRVLKSGDMTKVIRVGDPDHAHLVPDRLKSVAVDIVRTVEPYAPLPVTPSDYASDTAGADDVADDFEDEE